MTTNSAPASLSFPLSTETARCYECFTFFWEHIKNFALRFFRWLFCCPSITPKPLSNAEECKETKETKKIELVTTKSLLTQSNSSTSSSVVSSSTSSTTFVETRGRSDEGQAIVNGYCNALSRVENQEERLKVFNETGELLLRCLNMIDQLSMLQKCSKLLTPTPDWTAFIRLLPPVIQKEIDSSHPVFSTLYDKYKTQVITLPSAEKLFLHQILSNIFLPRKEMTFKHFSKSDLEEFQSFSDAEQFFILYTLFVIGMNDKALSTNLNYTEISKLINNSKIKDEFYNQIIEQNMSIDGRTITSLKELYESLGDAITICNISELKAYFPVMEKIKEKNPDWLLVHSLVSAALLKPTALAQPLARQFIIQLLNHLKNQNTCTSLDRFYVKIINGLARAEDQFFMLQQLAIASVEESRIQNWEVIIDNLSPELQKLIYSKFAELDNLNEKTYYDTRDEQRHLALPYRSAKSLLPVFDALVKEKSEEPKSLSSSPKELLQEAMLYACWPLWNTKPLPTPYPTTETLKTFSSFKTQEQVHILHFLFLIMNMMSLESISPYPFKNDKKLFNSLWQEFLQTIKDSNPTLPNHLPETTNSSAEDFSATARIMEFFEKQVQAERPLGAT